MFIHNATFMIELHRETEFVNWLNAQLEEHKELAPASHSPRITAMRMAGGVDYTQAEAQSIAFQLEFNSIEDANRWSNEHFASLAARFEEKFAPAAMVFTSIFEVINN